MIFEIGNEDKYRLSGDVLFREVDGEIIIIPHNSGISSAKKDALFTLTGSGMLIWNLLDGTTTVQQLIDHVLANYDVPEDRVRKDVVAFLENLAAHGMICRQ